MDSFYSFYLIDSDYDYDYDYHFVFPVYTLLILY